MINKIYIIIGVFLMIKGVIIVYEEDQKGSSKNKKLWRVGYLMMSISVVMSVIYIIFFTTDGLYGQLP